MQNRVAVIHDDPLRLALTFRFRAKTGFAQLVLHIARNRANMRAGRARTNDEIIGDDGLLAHIQNRDVERLQFIRSATNQRGFTSRIILFQSANIRWL